MVAALGAALFLVPAHVKGFYMSRPQMSLAPRGACTIVNVWNCPAFGESGRRRACVSGRQLPTEGASRNDNEDGALLLRRLGAQALFLFAQFRRQRLAEILRIENLPDFDLAVIERCALHPVDRLVQRFDLDQPEAGDEP